MTFYWFRNRGTQCHKSIRLLAKVLYIYPPLCTSEIPLSSYDSHYCMIRFWKHIYRWNPTIISAINRWWGFNIIATRHTSHNQQWELDNGTHPLVTWHFWLLNSKPLCIQTYKNQAQFFFSRIQKQDNPCLYALLEHREIIKWGPLLKYLSVSWNGEPLHGWALTP